LVTDELKQVIVFRRDLKLSRGKVVVQGAHAALGAFERAQRSRREWVDTWSREGQRKIAVQVDSLDDLLDLHSRAQRIPLPCFLVRDAGYTEIPPGTVTALGIGPAPEDAMDRLTGDLKLM